MERAAMEDEVELVIQQDASEESGAHSSDEEISDDCCFFNGVHESYDDQVPGFYSFKGEPGEWDGYLCWSESCFSWTLNSVVSKYSFLNMMFCCYPDRRENPPNWHFTLYYATMPLWMPFIVLATLINTAGGLFYDLISLFFFLLSCGCCCKYSVCAADRPLFRWHPTSLAQKSVAIRYKVRKYGCCGPYRAEIGKQQA
jgi:hypothetical protein